MFIFVIKKEKPQSMHHLAFYFQSSHMSLNCLNLLFFNPPLLKSFINTSFLGRDFIL